MSTLELRHFEVVPYDCIGKPCICSFPPMATCYARGGASCAHKRDDLYQIYSKVAYGEPACSLKCCVAVLYWLIRRILACLKRKERITNGYSFKAHKLNIRLLIL